MQRVTDALRESGFAAERCEWSINFKGESTVRLQLSTEEAYHGFPSRAVAADVHGILLRVASLQHTLAGKIKAWNDEAGQQSKRIKDLADIVRLIEAHPHLWRKLPPELQQQVAKPHSQ